MKDVTLYSIVMMSPLSCSKISLILLLFLIHVIPTDQRYAEFEAEKVSPNWTFVARGQPLRLNVTLNSLNQRFVFIFWHFRRFSSSSFVPLLSLPWNYGRLIHKYSHDNRASATDNVSLLLVNTTLNDSGTYLCKVSSRSSFRRHFFLYFNVTVEDEPKAEITCSQNTKLIEGEKFSCWCNALGVHLVPTAAWVKNGNILGNPSNFGRELSLVNVKKDASGTYICRAQLYSLMDEKTTEIVVHFRPRIISFQRSTSENNSLILTCLADGLPMPTYAIHVSGGRKLLEVVNGVVVIANPSSIINATYTCVAENNLGRDERRLKMDNSLSLPDKSWLKRISCDKESEWYIRAISAIIGIILGFGFLYGFQWIRRKKAIAKQQRKQQVEENRVQSDPAMLMRSQHGNCPNVDTPLYDQPVTSTRSSADCLYQELQVGRSDEENTYQNLRLTTRMKSALESSGQR